jgi:hypothetical protein
MSLCLRMCWNIFIMFGNLLNELLWGFVSSLTFKKTTLLTTGELKQFLLIAD